IRSGPTARRLRALGGLGLGFLVSVLLLAGVGVAAAGAVGRRLLLVRASSVVGRVKPGALEVHRDRVEDSLEGTFAADLTLRRRCVAHPLKELENVSVRTTILVDGHVLTVAAGPSDTACLVRRRTPFCALELD